MGTNAEHVQGHPGAEFVRDVQRDMAEGDSLTVSSEGRSVTIMGGKGSGGTRQAVLPGMFPSVEQYVQQIVDTVQELADSTVGKGLTAAVQSKIEIAGQFETDDGTLMDAVISIGLKAKPAKVE